MKKVYLVLENGSIFQGYYFGIEKEVFGEVVFTTGMTGYLETLTDPSYTGQIVVQTFPLIGNYGIIPTDFESCFIGASAYIVKEWCQDPSNFRSEEDIDTFFKSRGMTGLYDIDTRALTKLLREYGTMNGVITENFEAIDLEKLKKYQVIQPVTKVSVKQSYEESAKVGKYKVVVLDFGLKENIKRELLLRNCDLCVMPHNATAEQILALKPDGVMLTNGPGDPKDNKEAIDTIYQLFSSGIPIFGICLGHQLLALANGFQTKKMKYGHRGANQAVKDTTTKRVYITSQNHGYEVVAESIDETKARVSYFNANDNTCEGIAYIGKPSFSVQFHPEACGGPRDSTFLFDYFIEMMEEYKNQSFCDAASIINNKCTNTEVPTCL